MSTTASDLSFKTSPPLIKSNLFSRRSTTASSLALIGGRLEVLGADSVNLTMQVGSGHRLGKHLAAIIVHFS